MTKVEFCFNFTRAIAEDDRDICECCRCGASDLTNSGLGIIAEIVMAEAEPLFDRIAELEAQVAELEAQVAELEARVSDERAHWTMANESGVSNG